MQERRKSYEENVNVLILDFSFQEVDQPEHAARGLLAMGRGAGLASRSRRNSMLVSESVLTGNQKLETDDLRRGPVLLVRASQF